MRFIPEDLLKSDENILFYGIYRIARFTISEKFASRVVTTPDDRAEGRKFDTRRSAKVDPALLARGR